MNLNIFSRSISTSTYTSTRRKLYNYFNNTPHFVFFDFDAPPISRLLKFRNVQRITLIGSSYDTIGHMINTNVFPNLSYLRHLVDISTPPTIVDKVEAKIANMTEFLHHNIVDCEVSYLDFNNPRHLDIKKISNNFSGFDVGEINNTQYSQYLTEYITKTHNDYLNIFNSIHSENSHLLQEVEELQLQQQQVLAENSRCELR